MSEQTHEKRRDTVTSIDASHLNEPIEKEEDWDDVAPSPATNELDELDDDDFDDDELEQELSTDQVPPVITEIPVVAETVVVPEKLMEQLEQLEQFQTNLSPMIEALETRIKEIDGQRKILDAEQQSVTKRLNFLRLLNNSKTTEEAPKRKRGRRPNSEKQAEAAANGTTLPTNPEQRPRKRPHNEMTFPEAILKAMFVMEHNGKPYTGSVNNITQKTVLPKEQGGIGYNTTSNKQNNTVRIQLYRLEDKKKVVQNEDKTFSLRPETVEELKAELEAAKNVSTEAPAAVS